MRLIVSILVTALFTFACGLYLPWWSAAFAPFIVALLIRQRPIYSFFSGFCGMLLLWLILIIVIDSANNGILSSRVSMLLGLGPSPTILIIINCVVGALVGGMGALTGSLLRKVL